MSGRPAHASGARIEARPRRGYGRQALRGPAVRGSAVRPPGSGLGGERSLTELELIKPAITAAGFEKKRMLTALTERVSYIRSGYICENDSAMAMIESNAERMLPLTPAVFHVLLALVEGERHGYAIMQEVAESTRGQINMGPGTLYGTIKRLLEARLIEESDRRPDPELDDARRRYYRLSGLGQQVVKAEALRYEQLAKLARRKRLLGQTARVGHARGL